jgi:hypothetical protein
VNSVDPVLQTQANDTIDIEVRSNRFAWATDLIGFVCFKAVEGETIFVRVDGDRSNFDFMCASKDSGCNFAAIGCQ